MPPKGVKKPKRKRQYDWSSTYTAAVPIFVIIFKSPSL